MPCLSTARARARVVAKRGAAGALSPPSRAPRSRGPRRESCAAASAARRTRGSCAASADSAPAPTTQQETSQ
eukprot:2513590-Pleurochrysis_carterae.AAC.1